MNPCWPPPTYRPALEKEPSSPGLDASITGVTSLHFTSQKRGSQCPRASSPEGAVERRKDQGLDGAPSKSHPGSRSAVKRLADGRRPGGRCCLCQLMLLHPPAPPARPSPVFPARGAGCREVKGGCSGEQPTSERRRSAANTLSHPPFEVEDEDEEEEAGEPLDAAAPLCPGPPCCVSPPAPLFHARNFWRMASKKEKNTALLIPLDRTRGPTPNMKPRRPPSRKTEVAAWTMVGRTPALTCIRVLRTSRGVEAAAAAAPASPPMKRSSMAVGWRPSNAAACIGRRDSYTANLTACGGEDALETPLSLSLSLLRLLLLNPWPPGGGRHPHRPPRSKKEGPVRVSQLPLTFSGMSSSSVGT